MEENILKNRLMYRSVHRGCKETDILLGEFAKAKLENLNQEQLSLYKGFIEEDDMMIYDWILEKVDIPKKYSNLIKDIQAFHNL